MDVMCDATTNESTVGYQGPDVSRALFMCIDIVYEIAHIVVMAKVRMIHDGAVRWMDT